MVAFRHHFIDHAPQAHELRERMPTFGFFTTRVARRASDPSASPSLADMEAARIGLQRRLRSPRLWLVDAAGATLQRLPSILPAVARITGAVLRRETRAEP
jgi:hypothetical protein